MVNGEIGRGL